MIFVHHLVAFIPLAELGMANRVFELLRDTTGTDWGPGNLSVQTTNKQNGDLTHYGMAVGLTEADHAVMVGMFDRSERPRGTSAAEVTAFKKLLWHVEPYGQRPPLAHFNEALTTFGLRIVQAPLT